MKELSLVKMLNEIQSKSLSEAKFKGVKVTYSNGTHVTTSVNPNVTDEQIRRYFKIGSTANIGSGDRDKVVKIVDVEILPEEEF